MSTNHTPEYVEIGCRLYQVVVVPAPLIRSGRVVPGAIDHDQQAIEVSDAVPEFDRAHVVAKAVAQIERKLTPVWRQVPVIGRVA